jgi:chaperonin GroEL (HSP60 family)
MCDPVRHAVLEPTASKRAAIAAAMACVASLTKIDQIAVARRGR